MSAICTLLFPYKNEIEKKGSSVAVLVNPPYTHYFLWSRLADEYKVKGNAAYKCGMYEEAQQHYTKAIFHNPNCATYWSNRSAALMMMQDYVSALDDCTQAIKLDETFTKVSSGCCVCVSRARW